MGVVNTNAWLQGLETDMDLNEFSELEEYFSDSDPMYVDETKIDIPSVTERFNRIIVVDNVPVVSKEKLDKLITMITTLFGRCGTIHTGWPTKTDTGVFLPFDSNQNVTKGIALITYTTSAEANNAVTTFNSYKLDSKHTFIVNLMTDVEKYLNWPKEYVDPVKPEFKPKPATESWLLDEHNREQFLLRYGSETEVHWIEGLNLKSEITLANAGEREKNKGRVWCDRQVKFTPQGSYLATFHRPGVALWSGDDFGRTKSLVHRDVLLGEFSKCERFALTSNATDTILWNLQQERQIRVFKHEGEAQKQKVIDMESMEYQFSAEGIFVVRQIKDGIQVYSSETGKMIEKKPIKTKGIQEYALSPKGNLLAYWSPESGNHPCHVAILDLELRSEIRSLQLFNVTTVTLTFNSTADFLCARVLRHSKSGKINATNLELFLLKQKLVPNETISAKHEVLQCGFEFDASAFTKDQIYFYATSFIASEQKFKVDFYLINVLQGKVEFVKEVSSKDCCDISFSPDGKSFVMTNFKQNKPAIEFYSIEEKEIKKIAEQQHHTAKFVSWDHGGRMLASVSHQNMFKESVARDKVENGVILWSFQGEQVNKLDFQDLYFFQWRPRPNPEVFLSKEELDEIKRHAKDEMLELLRDDEMNVRRREVLKNKEKLEGLKAFRNLVNRSIKDLGNYFNKRRKQQGWVQVEDEEGLIEVEEIEEVLLNETVENI